jgi:hypothetical protein
MTEITELASATALKPKKSVKKSPPGMGGLVNLALMVWMIWDLRHRSDEELNGKRKWWMLAAFAPPIGPIAYFIYLRRRRTQLTEIPLEPIEQL